eukprot:2979398-Pleurochrysis_carterae.AAC.1
MKTPGGGVRDFVEGTGLEGESQRGAEHEFARKQRGEDFGDRTGDGMPSLVLCEYTDVRARAGRAGHVPRAVKLRPAPRSRRCHQHVLAV